MSTHPNDNPDTQFWFNSRTGEVEKGPQSLAQYRVGPFETEAEAARAPEVIKERAAKWAAEEAAED